MNTLDYHRLSDAIMFGINQSSQVDRRERIATAVLAGFAAAPGLPPSLKDLVSGAVRWADALIAELDKREDKT